MITFQTNSRNMKMVVGQNGSRGYTPPSCDEQDLAGYFYRLYFQTPGGPYVFDTFDINNITVPEDWEFLGYEELPYYTPRPMTLTLAQGSTLPVGVSFVNGFPQGVPVESGNFAFRVLAITSESNESHTFFLEVAPPLSIEPDSIQVHASAFDVEGPRIVDLPLIGGWNDGYELFDNIANPLPGGEMFIYRQPTTTTPGQVLIWTRYMGGPYNVTFTVRTASTPGLGIVSKTIPITILEPNPAENPWLTFEGYGIATLPPSYDPNAPAGKKVIIEMLEPATGHQLSSTFYLNSPAYAVWHPPAGYLIIQWSIAQEIPNTGDPHAPQPLESDKDWFNAHRDDPLTGLWDIQGMPTPEEMREVITEFKAIYNEMLVKIDKPILEEITPVMNAGPVNRPLIMNQGQGMLNSETARIGGAQGVYNEVSSAISQLNQRFMFFLNDHPWLGPLMTMDFNTPNDMIPPGEEGAQLKAELQAAQQFYKIIRNFVQSRKDWQAATIEWLTRQATSLVEVTQNLNRITIIIADGAALLAVISQKQFDIRQAFDRGDAFTLFQAVEWAYNAYFTLRDEVQELRTGDFLGSVLAVNALSYIESEVLVHLMNEIILYIEQLLNY